MKVKRRRRIGLDEYGYKRIENKICGENRVGIFHEGRLGRTAKEEELSF
jgi:hypothetical protein